jgi:hypothetical protein
MDRHLAIILCPVARIASNTPWASLEPIPLPGQMLRHFPVDQDDPGGDRISDRAFEAALGRIIHHAAAVRIGNALRPAHESLPTLIIHSRTMATSSGPSSCPAWTTRASTRAPSLRKVSLSAGA